MAAVNRYLVIGSGVKEGKPYANLKMIREGKKKETGEAYAFLDDNTFVQEAEQIPIGSILRYERKRIEDSDKRFPATSKA